MTRRLCSSAALGLMRCAITSLGWTMARLSLLSGRLHSPISMRQKSLIWLGGWPASARSLRLVFLCSVAITESKLIGRALRWLRFLAVLDCPVAALASVMARWAA